MTESELQMRQEFYRNALIRRILRKSGSPVRDVLQRKIKPEDIKINENDIAIFSYDGEEFVLTPGGNLYSMKTLD